MTIEKMPTVTRISDNFQTPQHTVLTSREDKPAVSPHHSTGDKINLSYLHALSEQSTHSDIDYDKVNRLQQALAQGTYSIDAHKIAEAILASTQEDQHE